jgi:hypothetical protein
VHVLRTRPLNPLFLNFVARLPAAELLRVLLTVALHALRAAYIEALGLTIARLVAFVGGHQFLHLNALHLQHLLHVALQCGLLVYVLKAVGVVLAGY